MEEHRSSNSALPARGGNLVRATNAQVRPAVSQRSLQRVTAFDNRTRPTLPDKATGIHLASDRINAPSHWILAPGRGGDFTGSDHARANDRCSDNDRGAQDG